MSRKRSLIPLVPSSTMGITIKLLQLPRLWLKLIAEARGELAKGYPGAGKGYDDMIINGLGLKRDAVLKFVREQLPSYPEFESWIRVQPGVNLEPGNLAARNADISGYEHDEATCKGVAEKEGLPADVPRKALIINFYDDLGAVYRQLVPKNVRERRKAKYAPKQETATVAETQATQSAAVQTTQVVAAGTLDANTGVTGVDALPGAQQVVEQTAEQPTVEAKSEGEVTTENQPPAGTPPLAPGEFRVEAPANVVQISADQTVEQAPAAQTA